MSEFAKSALEDGVAVFGLVLQPSGEGFHFEIQLDGLNDPSGAVSLDECETFSRRFAELVDAEIESGNPAGIFPDGLTVENYTMEVSSAGAERMLHLPDDLERFKGRPLKIQVLFEGKKESRLAVFEGMEESRYCFRPYEPVRKGRKRKAGRKKDLTKDGEHALLVERDNLIQANLFLDF